MNKYKIVTKVSLKTVVTHEIIKDAKSKLIKLRKKISKQQDAMYAHGKYSMLVCLQGMDTSGKDSLIREVFKSVNASGVVVHSFKVPTEQELKHDFLWRHYIALPERGKIGVFNRTHYENVLVTRVHPNYIFGENIPSVKTIDDINDIFYHNRMDAINTFEKHIADNGTIVLKFFLNISKDEQKKRLLRRLNIPEKNWKFSAGDLKERKLWNAYQDCYEDAINRTSKVDAPWYIVPADDKPTTRLIVAQTIYEALKSREDIKEPILSEKDQVEVENWKRELNNE